MVGLYRIIFIRTHTRFNPTTNRVIEDITENVCGGFMSLNEAQVFADRLSLRNDDCGHVIEKMFKSDE